MATFFPAINSSSVICQLPYQETDDFVNDEASVPAGLSYTNSNNEQPLKRWVLQYPSITSAELEVLESFFDSMNGTLGEFSFVDNQGTTWTATRFDQNQLDVVFPQPGQVSVTIKLLAQPNP